MILGLLAGNTSLRYGSDNEGAQRHAGRIEWKDLEQRAEALATAGAAASLCIAGSVRDDLLETVRRFLPAALWPPLLAGRDFPIPLENRYLCPAEVGTDRLLNALAARSLAPGRAVVTVDFGTAISLGAVSPDGAFLGGAIASGSRALLQGLQEAAPRLPRVEPAVPDRFIQRSTREAIRCGVFWQIVGGVRSLLQGMMAELGSGESMRVKPLVLATGGAAEFFAGHIPEIEQTIPDLTLRGLFVAYTLAR